MTIVAEKRNVSNRETCNAVAIIARIMRYPTPLPFVENVVSVLLRGLLPKAE